MLNVKALLTKIIAKLNFSSVTPYQIRTVTRTQTVSGNSGASLSFSVPSISGYTPVGYVRWSNNHGNTVYLTSLSSIGSCYIYNSASGSQSCTIDADILYIRNALLGGVVSRLLNPFVTLFYRKGVTVC